jgi:hypothetical protein
MNDHTVTNGHCVIHDRNLPLRRDAPVASAYSPVKNAKAETAVETNPAHVRFAVDIERKPRPRTGTTDPRHRDADSGYHIQAEKRAADRRDASRPNSGDPVHLNATSPPTTVQSMTLPNFLLIGAAKAGTSSIHNYLKQHPEIFLSENKEPRFFAFDGRTAHQDRPWDRLWADSIVVAQDAYESLFDGVRGEKAIGESSTIYLASPHAASRIKHHVPQAKLIASLRNPIDRAYSHYQMCRARGLEPLETFEEAIAAEQARSNPGLIQPWNYLQRGLYYEQLRTYLELFDREQIHIVLFEDLKRDSHAVLKNLCAFLGVDDSFEFDTSKKKNVRHQYKSRRLERVLSSTSRAKPLVPGELHGPARNVLQGLRRLNWGRRDPMKEQTRRMLARRYAEDITNLGMLIDRDLSHWRS